MTRVDFTHIHSAYCHSTNLPVALTLSRVFMWESWNSRGWTEADLELVVKHIKARITEHRRHPEALKFRNLIGDLDGFEESLCDARAWSRQTQPRPDSGRAQVLAQSGRMEPVKDTVRSAAQIIAGEKAFEMFRQLKNTL